jgi:nicotinamide mononucleotide transporter
MVAKKVLENWIYWFVIDALSIYLYASRGLPLYAALFALYLVLIVIGYRRWLGDYRAQRPAWGSA